MVTKTHSHSLVTCLEIIGGHHSPLYISRPGRDLEHHANLYTCEVLSLPINLGQRARGWPSAHASKASYIEAIHELHQRFRPFACEMLRAHRQKKLFPKGSSHRHLVVADRLLEAQVLDLDVLYGMVGNQLAIRLTWSHRIVGFCTTIRTIWTISQVARNIGTRAKITRPCRRYINERFVNSSISGRYPSL